MRQCWPEADELTTGSVSWTSTWAQGYRTVSVTLLGNDQARLIVSPANGRGGSCNGRYVLTCPAGITQLLSQAPTAADSSEHAPLAPKELDVTTLRSHADMLSRIVSGREGEASWLSDLEALAGSAGSVTYLVAAVGDEVGWRAQGSSEAFRDAVQALAARRLSADRARETSGWMSAPPYAVEVVEGTRGWTRVDVATTITGARARLAAVTPPRDLDQVLGTRAPTFEIWTGAWAGTDGRTGYAIATRARPGESDVIVDGNIADPYAKREERRVERTKWTPGGDALACVEKLTKAGSVGHGARLGKALAELSAEGCEAIRERGFGADRFWMVEVAPKR